jgi:preprotein translocase subunit Sss1
MMTFSIGLLVAGIVGAIISLLFDNTDQFG